MEPKLTKGQKNILNQIKIDLKSKKIRLTKGRYEVLQVIVTNYHPTFNDVVNHLEKITNKKPNIMSVYNTINMLLANDIIYANTFAGQQISYEVKIVQTGHLKCDNCLKVIHLNQLTNFNKNFKELAQKHHWTCDHFKLEIHGLCPQCQRKLT